MKLQTTIKPRKDGTVIVRNANGSAYEFKPDEHGDLVADIDDVALVAQLLKKSDDFMPQDPADFEAAAKLVGVGGVVGLVGGVSPSEDDFTQHGHTPEGSPPGEGEDEPDDEGDEGAAPIEGTGAPVPAAEAPEAPQRPSRRRS